MTVSDSQDSIEIRRERARVVARELARIFPGKLKTPLNYSKDYELLVAVILSAQTTDKKVNEVTERLFKKYSTLDELASASLLELREDISEIGLRRAKARYIRDSAQIIKEKHNSKVPRTMEELIELPGVGRKTANVVLGHLYEHVEGIAVDTHVVRLANKFGLVDSGNPVVIERDLMALLPQKSWWDVSYRLKAYGREISPARHGFDDPISAKLIEKGLIKSPLA